MNVLVTGGAGYIGSHTVKALVKKSHKVFVFDNLSTGNKKLVDPKAKLIVGDILSKNAIVKAIKNNKIDAIIHFAGLISVSESFSNPEKYYEINVKGGKNVLEAMVECKVKHIVFSSSAAVYGNAQRIPIKEADPKKPTSPYGRNKLEFEKLLGKFSKKYGIKYVSLRYFNAAGADINAEIGEMHDPETHLIPIVLDVALEKRKEITIFGDDYKTLDGTCVRDYIHVVDLADAHVLALEYMRKKKKNNVFNLGSQSGFSNMEIVHAVQRITGKSIKLKIGPRRKGDPPVLIASSEKAKKELCWEPKLSDIDTIIKTAWQWHQKIK
ncbi:MAG: UDP-glucose 4-epimerase GalE [Candidatus Woesearchaeota archaeon]